MIVAGTLSSLAAEYGTFDVSCVANPDLKSLSDSVYPPYSIILCFNNYF